MNGTHQAVILILVSGNCLPILGLLITDGGQEVELGMVSVAADHAVGIGQLIKETTGVIVFPSKGRCQTFQIHLHYDGGHSQDGSAEWCVIQA